VLVTAAGQELLSAARRVLLDVEDLLESARQRTDPLAGPMRIGVIPTIGPYLLPEIDPALRAAFPRLSLVWSEEKTEVLVARVKAGEIDAALLALEADLGDLEHELVGRDRFVLATPKAHPSAKGRGPVHPSELRDQEVLLLDDGHCFRDQALELCTASGARELGFRATSLATLSQMVAGGQGVTLLPELAVEVENRRGALAIRSFCEPVPFRTVVLAWRRRSALAPALRAIARAARAAFKTGDTPRARRGLRSR
jgi:LysR family hydrogen peroxide-inducible transcriptional activator